MPVPRLLLMLTGLLALAATGRANEPAGTAEGKPPSAEGKPSATVIGLQYRPLEDILRAVVSQPELDGALVGVQVARVGDGRVVFAHHADQLINPASVTKMFTTAAALCLLHPDFRFKTEIYARDQAENGAIDGPLYLKGYGDPFLVNERLTYLASYLRTMGIEKIDGPLILDDSYFDGVWEGPGWSQDESSRPYQAPMGALSLNFNTVAVLFFPGEAEGKPARIELYPDTDAVKLVNKTSTAVRGTRCTVDVDKHNHTTRVRVGGRVSLHHPGSRTHCRVTNPTWYTGHAFRQELRRAGVRIRRGVRRGKVPRWAELIYTLRSPALGELVRKVNKRSQNFMAEQLYKTMGAELLGPPGTWHKGQQVMSAFLEEEVGIPAGTYVLHNGSGLNDVNRVSASMVVRLLLSMWKRFEVRPDFVASLAVSGADGTVARRLAHPAIDRAMRLKTGSLSNVRALAGYIHTRGGEVYAFCALVSDYSCRGYRISRLIDRMASAIARADRGLQVVEEIEVAPLADEVPTAKPHPIAPAGPPEGPEEADIPIGEAGL